MLRPEVLAIVDEDFLACFNLSYGKYSHPYMTSGGACVGGVARGKPRIYLVFRISRVVDEPTFEVSRVRGI